MKAMSDRPMSSMGYGRPRTRVKVHSNRAHAGVRAPFPFDLLRFPRAQKLQTPSSDSGSATAAGLAAAATLQPQHLGRRSLFMAALRVGSGRRLRRTCYGGFGDAVNPSGAAPGAPLLPRTAPKPP